MWKGTQDRRKGSDKFFVMCGAYDSPVNWYEERYLFNKIFHISHSEFGRMIPFEREVEMLVHEKVEDLIKNNNK